MSAMIQNGASRASKRERAVSGSSICTWQAARIGANIPEICSHCDGVDRWEEGLMRDRLLVERYEKSRTAISRSDDELYGAGVRGSFD